MQNQVNLSYDIIIRFAKAHGHIPSDCEPIVSDDGESIALKWESSGGSLAVGHGDERVSPTKEIVDGGAPEELPSSSLGVLDDGIAE